MTRKVRISSPDIFRSSLNRCVEFNRHEWLFDSHPGITSAFRPHVSISLNTCPYPSREAYGFVGKVARKLVVHSELLEIKESGEKARFESLTYITISPDDDRYLKVAIGSEPMNSLTAKTIFRANDALAADQAVKLKLGFAALPKFLVPTLTNPVSPAVISLNNWRVTDAYLRVQSVGTFQPRLNQIQKTLLPTLRPFLRDKWVPFGEGENVLSLVKSL